MNTPIYPLRISDVQPLTATSQDYVMDGYSYLARRGYTKFDFFLAHNTGFALRRGDKHALVCNVVEAAQIERMEELDT
jgi:hypothetical protein